MIWIESENTEGGVSLFALAATSRWEVVCNCVGEARTSLAARERALIICCTLNGYTTVMSLLRVHQILALVHVTCTHGTWQL